MELSKESDVNQTLAALVTSRDLRLWEGFPVVLAFCAEKEMFDYGKTASRIVDPEDKSAFGLLTALSLALYKFMGLGFVWADNLYNELEEENRLSFENYRQAFASQQNLSVGKYQLSSERLQTTFRNYFNQKKSGLQDLLFVKEELGLEQALSQVFSPKQKELFLKKLKSEKLTKTEKEYFSRVVKKRVLALANTQLHQLAQRLLRDIR